VNATGSAIESLTLQDGHITRPQLQKFISPTQPLLTYLRLTSVKGLTNHDLSTFLLLASPSLRHLFITDCIIERGNQDEEYAVDTSMQRMVCLVEAQIEGPGLASDLAIKRKHRGVIIAGFHSKISISSALESDMRDVVGALQTTAWQSVSLVHAHMPGWDLGLRERVYDMARARGISFRALM
jgi:hypothetical protein